MHIDFCLYKYSESREALQACFWMSEAVCLTNKENAKRFKEFKKMEAN
jgi:hypothetical protein